MPNAFKLRLQSSDKVGLASLEGSQDTQVPQAHVFENRFPNRLVVGVRPFTTPRWGREIKGSGVVRLRDPHSMITSAEGPSLAGPITERVVKLDVCKEKVYRAR